MKRILSIMMVLMTIILCVGCGNSSAVKSNDEIVQDTEVVEETNDVSEESKETEEQIETPDVNLDSPVVNIDSLITEKNEADLKLKPYEYSFEDRNVEKEGESVFYLANFEDKTETFSLSDSINLYGFNGVCLGHTKPNIKITIMGQYENWYYTYLGGKTRFIKASDVEEFGIAYSGNKESSRENNDVLTDNSSNPVTVTPETVIPIEDITIEEAPVENVPSNDKYTPEEAVAVYRSLMEAGGITWDPALKNGGSWGTGWIYLEKGQPEWTASANLESFAMGDTVGNPSTKYYLEVTGSDENAVYITHWHN